MTSWIVFTGTAIVQVCVLRRLRFDWFVVALGLAGTLVSVSYLGYTSISERNYDGPAHVEYIDTIAEHFRLPPVRACVACGHPPLYYALAALWSWIVLGGGFIPRELGLQWLSLLLFFGFVVFALLIFRSSGGRPATLRLAAALVVFWPSSIINSVRVHIDALASLLLLAAMYFIAQWNRQGRPRDFYAAVAVAALALLTKATGYAAAATLVIIAALRLRSTRWSRASIQQLAAAILVLASTALVTASLRTSTYALTPCQRVLGHACDRPREPTPPAKPIDYLYVDLRDFVSPKSTLVHAPEHEYFLNRLARSSLFGVMPLGEDLASKRHETLAVLLRSLLLTMVVACALMLPFARGVTWPRYRALVLASALMLVMLAGFGFVLPNPFHDDFRHIFPVLVPFCLLYAKLVERLRRWSAVWHKAGVGLGLLMVAASVAFFVRVPGAEPAWVLARVRSGTMSAMLKKTLLAFVVGIVLSPNPVLAQMSPQPPMPMVVDLKKVAIGSWASYTMTMGEMSMRAKLALVARDATSVSMETSMEGGMMAMMGGKMTVKLVMDPDPTTATKPVKQMVMQIGNQDPMLAPDTMPAQKYSKPDPSSLVGKETIKVAAGSFKTAHYRNKTQHGAVDAWVSEEVFPTGLVKLVTPPMQAGAQRVPGMVMELQATGKGAKPVITKRPKPFDPQKMMGGMAPAPGGKKQGKR